MIHGQLKKVRIKDWIQDDDHLLGQEAVSFFNFEEGGGNVVIPPPPHKAAPVVDIPPFKEKTEISWSFNLCNLVKFHMELKGK